MHTFEPSIFKHFAQEILNLGGAIPAYLPANAKWLNSVTFIKFSLLLFSK